MHPRTAPVVGLKGPLALGHGCHSSLRLATTSDAQAWIRSPLVSSSFRSLAGAVSERSQIAAVPPRSGDCSRVLTRFPWVKPPPAALDMLTSVTPVTALTLPKSLPPGNVPERLALRRKTVSFCQCRSHT